MRRALALARRGWGQTAPNPLVGAVIVRDGRTVGEGYHARYGAPHAEIMALRAAGEGARGATMFVTLEPCAHHGHTPPCADALLAAGIVRVVVAARDPNPVAAGGVERLQAAGVTVDVGLEGAVAQEMNAAFLHAFSAIRPWVTLKLAVSLDGAIADAAGRSRWITGERARRVVHRLRAQSDAIAVGIGTVLADDPALTVRDAPAPRVAPLRVIFDHGARLPLRSAVVLTAREVPTLVIVDAPDARRVRALENAGVSVLHAAGIIPALEELAARGVRSLLVEGGARLAGSLLAGALVNRLIIFRGSMLLGAGSLGAFSAVPAYSLDAAPRYAAVERRALGDDVMTIYSPASPAGEHNT
ncbi:MAG: bifunctional diaminohydroxyphosphoribosylaminopyrimidine deaminase/5-amino-6-(5-phosphoribosylamino)uracil reductase RibD [Gemmatimonadaceae bacterium]